MRVLAIQLENEEYDSLAALAARTGKQPEKLAAELLLAWVRGREAEQHQGDEASRRRFLMLRLQDKDRELAAIAAELNVRPEVVARWDERIRTEPEEWSKAFVFASKSVDPLSWEMTIRDRFYDLWGHRPRAHPG
jgi:hypothetical protein